MFSSNEVTLQAVWKMALTGEMQEHLINSRRNRTNLFSYHEGAKALVEELMASSEVKRLRQLSQNQRRIYSENLMCLLLDHVSIIEVDRESWIGYSRGKRNYVSGGCYYDHLKDEPLLSFSYYLNAIDHLTELGLIENHIAKAGHTTFSSRMRPTQALVELFDQHKIEWTSIGEFGDAGNSFIVKDSQKNIIAWPESGEFNLAQKIKNILRINRNLSRTYVSLCVPDETLLNLNQRLSNRPVSINEYEEFQKQAIDFSQRTLRRIFAMGNFSNGGRFYGGWWQNVPSELRKHIEIDGAATVEMDYSTMQPRILYASVGLSPPLDSYNIPEWEAVPRKTIKKLFSQLLNSDTTSANPNQWHRFAPIDDPDILPENWDQLSRSGKDNLRREAFYERYDREYSDLIEAVLEFHEPINADFFSGVWGATQSLDAEIAELTMLNLLNAPVPVTALPIHDSFVVRAGMETELRRAMTDAFYAVVDTDVKIDRDETVLDPPSDYEGDGLIVANEEFDNEVKEMCLTYQKYFLREQQWINQWGPLD